MNMAKMSDKVLQEAAKKVEREYPIHVADQYIIQRFVFEPRCNYMGAGRKWLVIKDRVTDKYVREESNPRVCMTFRDSWECIQYLRKKFNAKEETK